MSYPTGTILKRNDPKDNKFDRVEVVGPSSIRTSAAGEWVGGSGEAIIVKPVDEFGAPEIMPLIAAAQEYSIEFEPEAEPTHVVSEQRPVGRRLLSPEESFRQDAKKGEKKQSTRKRTPIVTD